MVRGITNLKKKRIVSLKDELKLLFYTTEAKRLKRWPIEANRGKEGHGARTPTLYW